MSSCSLAEPHRKLLRGEIVGDDRQRAWPCAGCGSRVVVRERPSARSCPRGSSSGLPCRGCARAGCAPHCRPWGSPSGSVRWSRWSGSRPRARPASCPRSTGSVRTSSPSLPDRRSWAPTHRCRARRWRRSTICRRCSVIRGCMRCQESPYAERPYVPAEQTGGIGVDAADSRLLAAVGGQFSSGSFLSAVNDRYPTVVLGAQAATVLQVTGVAGHLQVFLGGTWCGSSVTGRMIPTCGQTSSTSGRCRTCWPRRRILRPLTGCR